MYVSLSFRCKVDAIPTDIPRPVILRHHRKSFEDFEFIISAARAYPNESVALKLPPSTRALYVEARKQMRSSRHAKVGSV